MRHFRSILYSLVLAPAAWVLTAVGLTGDLTARGRDGFAVENFTGLLLLLLAGAAYGILVLGPFSPAGPLLAGVVYLAISTWALTSPSAYADVWPPAVAKDGFDLSRPGYGLAAILAVPLICTALSARRWAKYEPPVLPLIGQIGGARGAARPHGTPLSASRTTVISAGLSIMDPEPTTVLHYPAPDSTTALVPAGVGPHLDEDPTIAWAAPKALAAVATVDYEEETVASFRPQHPDEPTTVVDISAGEPTLQVTDEDPTQLVADEDPTELVASEGPTELVASEEPTELAASEEPTQLVADEEPTEDVADEEPAEAVAEEVPDDVVVDEPTADVPGQEPAEAVADEVPDDVVVDKPTEAVTGEALEGAIADEEPTVALADADIDADADADADADIDADAEPAAAADEVVEAVADEESPEVVAEDEPAESVADEDEEVTEPAAAAEVDDEPEDAEAPTEEATVATLVAAAERTEVIRLPVADNGEKTQVVRLPVADNGERTQVVRLPVAEVVPFPAVDPDEKTQVIRVSQVLQFPVRSPEAEPGQRTRDLSNRATGDVGGDETQVIRLAGKTVDDEKTQVIRPALITRPDDQSDVLAFRAPKLRDATPPSAADSEPTAPITIAAPATSDDPTTTANGAGPQTTAHGDEPTTTLDRDEPTTTFNGDEPTTKPNVRAPLSIADAEAPNFADDPTSPLSLPSLNGDEATETHSRSMTVMKMERPPDDSAEETTHLEIPTQRRPGTEE